MTSGRIRRSARGPACDRVLESFDGEELCWESPCGRSGESTVRDVLRDYLEQDGLTALDAHGEWFGFKIRKV